MCYKILHIKLCIGRISIDLNIISKDSIEFNFDLHSMLLNFS